MRNTSIITSLLVALFALILSCSTKTEPKEEETKKPAIPIIVYGDATCDHCIDFMEKLDLHELSYTFYDVQLDQARANEMIMKIRAIDFRGNLSLPIVQVGEELMVSPEFEDFLLKLEN